MVGNSIISIIESFNFLKLLIIESLNLQYGETRTLRIVAQKQNEMQ